MASNKFSDVEQAILTTLLYSDMFDFPLTYDELWEFLISKQHIAKETFDSTLDALSDKVATRDGYYCLRGREKNIEKRKKELSFIQHKLRLAKRAVQYLSYIPSVQFVGISGSLAMKNVTKDADIDLFVIVSSGKLFVTRFWLLCVLEWLGIRRRRADTFASDKICVNLLIDEKNLVWPTQRRDVYTAHEIAHVVPLFQRQGMYRKFIESNRWIKLFLPNVSPRITALPVRTPHPYHSVSLLYAVFFSSPFEWLMMKMQSYTMKKHKTREIITKQLLAFHPNDYRVKILSDLRIKCQEFGLLTKV